MPADRAANLTDVLLAKISALALKAVETLRELLVAENAPAANASLRQEWARARLEYSVEIAVLVQSREWRRVLVKLVEFVKSHECRRSKALLEHTARIPPVNWHKWPLSEKVNLLRDLTFLEQFASLGRNWKEWPKHARLKLLREVRKLKMELDNHGSITEAV